MFMLWSQCHCVQSVIANANVVLDNHIGQRL